jgi:apolipoprotein N-acyltransferase
VKASPGARILRDFAAIGGFRKYAAAFAAGVGAALAMAPFYLLPLMAVSYCALALLVDGARARERSFRAGFSAGWFFGFGYFLVSLYWVGLAFFVQAEEFAWMAPIAVAGLPAGLALFTGVAAGAAARLKLAGWRRILALAVLLMLAEYARGHLLTGLPWNLPGQALAGTAIGAQTAAIWGVYGLSLAALVIALLPAAFIGAGRRAFAGGGALMLTLIAGLYGAGAVRLALNPPADRDDAAVRIVQPNIPQREKIDNAFWRRNYERHIAMSSAPAPRAGTLFILWPENAVPVIDEVKEGLAVLSDALPKNSVLVAGAVRRETGDDGATLYYNSISVIAETPSGRVPIAHYDKRHLVPFGEYLPLDGLLRAVGLAQLAPYDEGFAKGEGAKAIDAGGPAFAALICYEAIFPGRVYPRGDRPDWIATVTNDSWFGDSAGPRQHFDQARLRAIETGLPMARSANSGVSGLIDGAGRVRARIRLYGEGVIDAPLPRALGATFYSRFGDLTFWLIMGLCAAAVIFPRTIKR